MQQLMQSAVEERNVLRRIKTYALPKIASIGPSVPQVTYITSEAP